MAKLKAVEDSPKGMTAEQVIAEHERKAATRDLPCEAALVELKKIMDANDRITDNHKRIRAEVAIDLLNSWGWKGGRSKFARFIREQFGRGWQR